MDHIPKAVKGTVQAIIDAKADRTPSNKLDMLERLELNHVLDRQIALLSGGELQRFAICTVAVQAADCYMFDEPSSYLDVKQRLTAAAVIRGIVENRDTGDRSCVYMYMCVPCEHTQQQRAPLPTPWRAYCLRSPRRSSQARE